MFFGLQRGVLELARLGDVLESKVREDASKIGQGLRPHSREQNSSVIADQNVAPKPME